MYDVAAGAFLAEGPIGTVETGLGIESEFFPGRQRSEINRILKGLTCEQVF